MSHWPVRLRGKERQAESTAGAAADTQEFVIEESFGYLVNRVARSMAGQLADELRADGVGIGQWAVLLFLWSRDGLSQAELARVVAIEPPTMARTIDRMVRDGLVTRAADPRDGRLSRINLTDRGRELRDRLVSKAIAVNKRTLERLTPSERKTLLRLMKKLLGHTL